MDAHRMGARPEGVTEHCPMCAGKMPEDPDMRHHCAVRPICEYDDIVAFQPWKEGEDEGIPPPLCAGRVTCAAWPSNVSPPETSKGILLCGEHTRQLQATEEGKHWVVNPV